MSEQRVIPAAIDSAQQDLTDMGDALRALRENAVVAMRGSDSLVGYFPEGIRTEGERQIATLPAYFFIPLRTPDDHSYGVPGAGFRLLRRGGEAYPGLELGRRALKFGRGNGEEVGRPMAYISIEPVIPGNNNLADLYIGKASWQPSLTGTPQVILGKRIRAVSPTERHRVAEFATGFMGDVDTMYSNRLRASVLAGAMQEWYAKNGVGDMTLLNTVDFYRSLAWIAELNPGWGSYFGQARAREEMGAALLDPAGPAVVAAALETFITAPSESHGQVMAKMREITRAIRGNKITDWDSFSQKAEDVFSGDELLPMMVHAGLHPLMAFISQFAELSAHNTQVIEQSMAAMFEDESGVRWEIVQKSDPLTVLLADPRLLTRMIEAWRLVWPQRLLTIADHFIGSVDAALGVSAASHSVQRAGLDALSKGMEGRRGSLVRQAEREGRVLVDEVARRIRQQARELRNGLFADTADSRDAASRVPAAGQRNIEVSFKRDRGDE